MNLVADVEEGGLERVDDTNANAGPSLHELLGIDSAGRMDLTEHERNLAINIKEAIASNPEVDPVSDFMCAQLALIDGDDTERAIERVHHLQCFREEYGILDTAADGKRRFRDHMARFPGHLLGFTYIPEGGGHYVWIYDNTQFLCNEFKRSEEANQAFMGQSYYVSAATCPDFEAIRSGCMLVTECDGYDWKRNLDFKILKKVWTEIGAVYPVLFNTCRFFNASNGMVIVTNMLKRFLPSQMKLEFGCQYDERLSTLYLVPTLEAASSRTLTNIGETLDRRYENERTFRL